MKLQKQLSRKVGSTEYSKWVLTVPPKIIKEVGWRSGADLEVKVINNTLVLKSKNK